MSIPHVRKRGGQLVQFELERIRFAVLKALHEAVFDPDLVHLAAEDLVHEAGERLRLEFPDREEVKVVEIQELVETILMERGYFEAATRFIRSQGLGVSGRQSGKG